MYVKSMEKFLSKENNAVASWFLGPRAENSYFVHEFYKEITDKHAETRRMQYFPEDPLFITKDMQNSDEYKSNIRSLRAQLQNLSDSLAEKTVPFWSPRHMGHMVTESTMPGHLAYVAALQYNQNNIAIEGSPLTTWLEVFAGKQLCEMLGFTVHWDTNESKDAIYDQSNTSLEQPPKIQGWGHITADGSVANLESMWAARNLKFYPLSLQLAVDDGLLSFIGSSFKVELANSKETKLLKECTTWELLNLKPTTILDIPDQLYNQYGITPQFLQHALYEYTIQTVGKDHLERKFNITEPTLYFTSATAHYSWAKGCAIVGIGSNNLIPVTVDNAARMDMIELDKLLSKCVEKKQAVYAVVAIMGSTEQGACDPLDDIVKLREKYEREHGLSFVIHGDAAWGGYFRSMLVKPPVSSQNVRRREGLEEDGDSFVPKLALHPYTERHLDSMKYCDSVTADPHKSGFIPFPAGSLCYRDQRMRYLNTWKSPVVVRNNDVSTGVYGIEGSKPGTAPAAAWLSHNAIGLHQKGYGLLLGQSTFSCTKLYCHWSTMSTEKDDFIVIPFNMLPAEKLIPPNPVEVKKQKEEIRLRIVRKSNIEIINDDFAMELIKKIGSDLMINTFACNFKVDGKINEDVIEANYLNQRLFERFSLTNVKGKNSNKPIILTSTQFKQKNYQGCLTNFKNRLGLKGDQDLYVLINVVMSPWVTEFEFHRQLATTFKEALQDLVKLSVKRNKVEPDHHVFVMQGTKKLYLTNLPMFQMENHRQQVIITSDLPRLIKYKYLDARRKNPSHVYYLGNQDVMTLDDIARDGASFRGVIYKDFDKVSEKPIVWIKDFRVTNVQVIKKRHLATRFQDANYPNGHVPFYLYGTNQELHIDHMLLKSPSIQLSADRVKLDLTFGKLTTLQRERGVVAHFTNVNELAMQPFPVIKPFPQAEPPKAPKTTPNPFPPILVPPFPIISPPKRFDVSFFFQGDRTFHVELYEDPIFNPYQSGPGLDNVKEPFAKGTIRLPTRNEGSLYTDSHLINEDPTRSSPIEPSINYFHEKFNRKDELYWYEEMDE